MRRILLALALLLAASPLAAYTIYLKDGGTLLAKEKYRVEGTLAIITLPSGAQTTLPLAQIDVAKTQASNATDFGNATVVEGPRATPTPVPTQRIPTLAELAARRGSLPPPPPRPVATPSVAPAPVHPTEPKPGGASHTSAGTVDLMSAPRTPISRIELASTVVELMRSHGATSVGIYEGTAPRRLLLEVTTNSEGAVFQAIGAAAQAILELETKKPGTIDALELFLVTERRQRAGQFLITRERARELIGKQLDLTGFYIKYVEF